MRPRPITAKVLTLLFWFIVAASLGGFVVGLVTKDEAVWDPLGEFHNPQTIIAPARQGAPTVLLAEHRTVTVEGTKCYGDDVAITILGSITWRSLDPPGSSSVPIAFAPAQQGPGCSTRVFENPIPEDVIRRTRQVGRPMLWQFGGTETPTRDDGTRGRPREWYTQAFFLDPSDT